VVLAVTLLPHGVSAALASEATLSRRLSHRQITPAARLGRVRAAERPVESSFRCLNSYTCDLVSQLVHVPRPPRFAPPSGLHPRREQRRAALLSGRRRLVREREATGEDHLSDVAQAELVLQALGARLRKKRGQSEAAARWEAQRPAEALQNALEGQPERRRQPKRGAQGVVAALGVALDAQHAGQLA